MPQPFRVLGYVPSVMAFFLVGLFDDYLDSLTPVEVYVLESRDALPL
jgi:hypothetical protein